MVNLKVKEKALSRLRRSIIKQQSMPFTSLRDFYSKNVIDVILMSNNLVIPKTPFIKEFKIQLLKQFRVHFIPLTFMLDIYTKRDKVDLQKVLHPHDSDSTPLVNGLFFHTFCWNYRHISYYSLPSPYPQQFGGQEISYNNFGEFIHQAPYESDEFYMYAYKTKKCTNLYVHDWTSCPFTHQGEKARRRNPRQYNYLPISCPGYNFASCIKKDNCELCHGVFEYWLHPAKYRTNPCHFGTLCNRQVCFFAHTLKELRPETKYNWCYVRQYPSHIQSYPDILIENEPNGNWMIIPCNPQLLPPQYYATIVSRHENSPTPQENTSLSELFAPSPLSLQSQSKTDQTIQNENNFSLFSASHAKLIEELKNLEIGSTS